MTWNNIVITIVFMMINVHGDDSSSNSFALRSETSVNFTRHSTGGGKKRKNEAVKRVDEHETFMRS